MVLLFGACSSELPTYRSLLVSVTDNFGFTLRVPAPFPPPHPPPPLLSLSLNTILLHIERFLALETPVDHQGVMNFTKADVPKLYTGWPLA